MNDNLGPGDYLERLHVHEEDGTHDSLKGAKAQR